MSKVQVFGIGAGGHSRVLMSALSLSGAYEPACLLDADPALHGKCVANVQVEGGDGMIVDLLARGLTFAFNGIGSSGHNELRTRLFCSAKELGVKFIDVIHPSACIDQGAETGEGLQLMACCVVNCGVRVGRNVLINSGAVVEHDCELGDHTVVSPGAVLCGGCCCGDGVFIGAGAVVREGVSIGRGALVAAGAVVLKNVPAGGRVAGVPARPM